MHDQKRYLRHTTRSSRLAWLRQILLTFGLLAAPFGVDPKFVDAVQTIAGLMTAANWATARRES